VARSRASIPAPGSDVRVEAPSGLAFTADPNLLEEVVSNLVSNAIEAKPTGAHVVVSAATAGRGVLLAVDDDGPGIPVERRASVFKPFVTTKTGGTGLGLAICRKIVEEHGGTIEVEASTLGGARFAVRLPPQA